MPIPKVLNKAKETTIVTGTTDDAILLGEVNPDDPFSDYLVDQQTLLYKIDDFRGNWESGVGVYNLSANSISRLTIISSSNFDQRVNFASGTKIVTSVLDAKIVQHILQSMTFPWW